jgi:hypothetical protein
MKLPSEVWRLQNPFKRLAWAVLLLARYEVLEEGEGADDAAKFLTGDEAADYLDLLGVDRECFLSCACEIDMGGAT